nr:D-alanine--D-alanine ligase [Treponema sp.]
MNIAVIYGGRSGEHEISLISAAAITRGIEKTNKVILIGIAKNGKWYLQDKAEYERILKDEKASLSIKEDSSKAVSVIP